MIVKVGVKKWIVQVVKDIRSEMVRAAGKKHWLSTSELDGCVDVERARILISAAQSQKLRASTFLHELIHTVAPKAHELHVRHIESRLFPILWSQGWRPELVTDDERKLLKKSA